MTCLRMRRIRRHHTLFVASRLWFFLTLCLLLWLHRLSAAADEGGTSPGPPQETEQISCNAAYSTPCTRINTEWLVLDIVKKLKALEQQGVEPAVYLNNITEGDYNMEIGFYPFVFDKNTSRCLAHGDDASWVGLTMQEIFDKQGLAYANAEALHRRFRDASERPGGDWVQYLWQNENTINGKMALLTSWNSEFYLGVGYITRQLPPDLPCSDKYDAWCSINNVLSLVGIAQLNLIQAANLVQFESVVFEISFDEKYRIPSGFYLFMVNYDGGIKAHGVLHDVFGKTLGDVFLNNNLGTYDEGMGLHQKFVSAAESEKTGWVQYDWRPSPDENKYTKIAYVIKVEFDELENGEMTEYYLGCGYAMQMDSVDSEGCSSDYNLPCSFRRTLQLTSHAVSHVISSPKSLNATFNDLSMERQFRIDDFAVFVFDFNGTCVAHGLVPNLYVGKTLQEIYKFNNIPLDADAMHEQFKSAALQGSSWVEFPWFEPGVAGSRFDKLSYIFGMNIGGRQFYGGCAFANKRAPVQPFVDSGSQRNGQPILCTQEYGEACSVANALAILGQAVAKLTLAASQSKESSAMSLNETLVSIINQDEDFRVNDFFVMVFDVDGSRCSNGGSSSGCCVAHGSNKSLVGRTWQEILDGQRITSISGYDLHRRLQDASTSGRGFIDYPWSQEFGSAQTKRAWASHFRDNVTSYYVVSEYLKTELPPTCDNCPTGMGCTRDDQAYCEKLSFNVSQDPMVLALLVTFGVCIPLVIITVIVCYFRRKSRLAMDKIKVIEEEKDHLANQLNERLVGMVEVIHDMPFTTPREYEEAVGQRVGRTETGVASAGTAAAWYWEDIERSNGRDLECSIVMHKDGRTYVRYAPDVSDQIEHAYRLWIASEGPKIVQVRPHDLSLANYNIAKDDENSSVYEINFDLMIQRYPATNNACPLHRALDLFPPLIEEVLEQGEGLLPTVAGQVIQVSKEHTGKQWLFGNVLYDPLIKDALREQQKLSSQCLNDLLANALHDRPTSGWFPKNVVKPAEIGVMQKLLGELGGEGIDSLRRPSHWEESSEELLEVATATEEFKTVARFFRKSLRPGEAFKVVKIERVQNLPLWQSYELKKQTMLARDNKNPNSLVNNRNPYVPEKQLFHGTAPESADKIIKQGFNRAFSGRKAAFFGKGVYFARDASHSCHYSKRQEGVQTVFLCRVAVGDWCRGREGQLTPDPKPHNNLELFDSTVDSESDPSIFVVYHDSQAYPEYLISFTR